jgi:hypothetical protein
VIKCQNWRGPWSLLGRPVQIVNLNFTKTILHPERRPHLQSKRTKCSALGCATGRLEIVRWPLSPRMAAASVRRIGRLDVRTAVVGVVAPAALLAGVAWASYGAGMRARVATDARLEAMLHDRPADAAALLRLMEANPGVRAPSGAGAAVHGIPAQGEKRRPLRCGGDSRASSVD